jgi:hypothetical protein
MLVGEEVPPPAHDTVTGLTFFGATPEEAERTAAQEAYDTPQTAATDPVV